MESPIQSQSGEFSFVELGESQRSEASAEIGAVALSAAESASTSELEKRKYQAGKCAARKLLAATLSFAALAGAGEAEAKVMHPPDPAKAIAAAHPLEIGGQDDGSVIKNVLGRADTVLKQSRDMGTSWWRMMVYPHDILHGKWEKYDAALGRMEKTGFKALVDIACKDVSWTRGRASRYMKEVVTHFGAEGADAFEICNEPNDSAWLRRMPGKSRPQTYRVMAEEGINAVRKYSTAEVYIGALSARGRPVQFMHETAQCPSDEKTCDPLEPDGYSFHPYLYTQSPTLKFKRAHRGRYWVGINYLWMPEKEIAREYKAGQLQTPAGETPKLEITEFAYMVKAPGKKSRYYISDRRRSKNYRIVLNQACHDPNVDKLFFYGFDPQLPGYPAPWNTPFVKPHTFKPYGSYRTIKTWLKHHPECTQSANANYEIK